MKKDKKYIPQKILIPLLISNFLLSIGVVQLTYLFEDFDDEITAFIMMVLFLFSVFTFLVYFLGHRIYSYFTQIKKWKRRLMISITPILSIPVYLLLEPHVVYIDIDIVATAYISINIVFLFYCLFAWVYDGYKKEV